MKKEIEEVLKKHLPEQITGELLKRFNILETAENQLIVVRKLVAELKEENKELIEFKEKVKSVEKREINLIQNEKDFEARRNTLKIEELKYQLEQEKTNTQKIYTLAKIVFKSAKPIYETYGFHDSVDQYGGLVRKNHESTTQEQE